MLNSLIVALGVAASGQCATCPPGGSVDFGPGAGAGSWSAGIGPMYPSYDAVSSGGGGGGDQLYPFDSPEPWLKGYFQEIPAYGGHSTFRPHNYKHVLAQTQVAGGWGINPTMAYSHQWYHRYRNRSGMHPGFGVGATGQAGSQNLAQAGPPTGAASPYSTTAAVPSGQPMSQPSLQQAAAIERGYPGTPIPGISTPYYQRSQIPQGAQQRAAASEALTQKFDAMQQQLEQQTFQMQLMQQQWQGRQQQAAQPNQARASWDQPAYQQFPGSQPPNAAQDVPGPSASYQQGQMATGPAPAAASAYNWQGQHPYGSPQTMQPNAQSMPYATGPQNPGMNMNYQGQPMYQTQPMPGQQMMPPNGMNYGPAQPGPIMQLPRGQAGWGNQQMMPARPGVPMSQPIPGMQTGWQQAAPMNAGPWGYAAQQQQQQARPDQVFYPQPYDAAQVQPMQGQPYYYNR